MSHYHLSYDFDQSLSDDSFSSYKEARKYLLCVLNQIPNIINIHEYCESTLIIELNEKGPLKLFQYLNKNLSPYFYYYISYITTYKESGKIVYSSNPNNELNESLLDELLKLDCDALEKRIRHKY